MDGLCMTDARDDEWDAFLAAHPDGHHEQSSQHGKNRADWGFRCDRVVVREGGQIVGGLQALAQPTPVGTLALVLRGPLAVDDNPHVLARVVHELDRLAERRSYTSVRVETFPTQVASRTALENGGFRSSVGWHGERRSLLVPLSFADKELLARMKPKGRYNVGVAQRAGVTIRTGDASSLDAFFELHRTTASHQGFPVFPREYFDYVWRLFGTTKKAQLFLAYHGGKPISAIFNTIVGGRLYYGWGGMSREPEHRKLMANYLLHFAAMGWAREHGCTHYDLVGVTEFKEKLERDQIQWPLPQRKFYGPLGAFRRALTEFAWSTPSLRRAVDMVARRMGLRRRIPY
jgi:lipid II:glycine glycyltransferase (peptidoglycan interpeptide bridge formation enzyme)